MMPNNVRTFSTMATICFIMSILAFGLNIFDISLLVFGNEFITSIIGWVFLIIGYILLGYYIYTTRLKQ